jgi:hypothetical protein
MKTSAAAGSQPPPRPLPWLGPGLHTGQECAGTLAPQGVVQRQDAKGLLDDVIGPGGAPIGPAAALGGVTGACHICATCRGARGCATVTHGQGRRRWPGLTFVQVSH